LGGGDAEEIEDLIKCIEVHPTLKHLHLQCMSLRNLGKREAP